MKSFEGLWQELARKIEEADSASGTVRAISEGNHFIAKKVIEEAGEVMLAAEAQGKSELATEIAQLIYWLQVLALKNGVTIDEIYERL